MGDETSHFRGDDAEFSRKLRRGMRATAMCVSLLTTRDEHGRYYGLAVTNPSQLSATPPSMVVAVDRHALPCSAINISSLYCLNHVSSGDLDRLDRFDRNDFLEANHETDPWRIGLFGLPYLETAATSYFCRVIGAHDYGDQTIYVGRIEGVRLNQDIDPAHADPLIWMNGGPVRLAGREML
jgi:flavin reductase (DIM6/NTAB) family NADH-FMN oxidoreductase RutF